MKNSPHRMNHQKNKAIRSAQKGKILKEPKSATQETIRESVTSPKTNKIMNHKIGSKKTSHMTSNKDTTWHTEPESIHHKGKKWMKNIQKKIIDKTTLFKKKFEKIKFLKKKK